MLRFGASGELGEFLINHTASKPMPGPPEPPQARAESGLGYGSGGPEGGSGSPRGGSGVLPCSPRPSGPSGPVGF